LTISSPTAKILKSNTIEPYFPLFLGKEVVRNRSNTAPLEPFGDSVERFFASLRFEQRGKLDEIGFQQDLKQEKMVRVQYPINLSFFYVKRH
jgi:hypothetical protein